MLRGPAVVLLSVSLIAPVPDAGAAGSIPDTTALDHANETPAVGLEGEKVKVAPEQTESFMLPDNLGVG